MNTHHLRKINQTDSTPENLSGEMQEDVLENYDHKGEEIIFYFKR